MRSRNPTTAILYMRGEVRSECDRFPSKGRTAVRPYSYLKEEVQACASCQSLKRKNSTCEGFSLPFNNKSALPQRRNHLLFTTL
ncbi:MAG: hypothetical protein AB1861_18545 [Cyanobacteriota bacterium]